MNRKRFVFIENCCNKTRGNITALSGRSNHEVSARAVVDNGNVISHKIANTSSVVRMH